MSVPKREAPAAGRKRRPAATGHLLEHLLSADRLLAARRTFVELQYQPAPAASGRAAPAPRSGLATSFNESIGKPASSCQDFLIRPAGSGQINSARRPQRRPVSAPVLLAALLLLLSGGLLLPGVSSMCQHHQALLESLASTASPSGAVSKPPPVGRQQQQQQPEGLIVCPKSSEHNNLPQFPSTFVSPALERQQRQIIKSLNASLVQHLQLGSGQPPVGAGFESPAAAALGPNELIDDELLNEIVSPLMLDSAYERAKELIVKRRKLESELVRQGESDWIWRPASE